VLHRDIKPSNVMVGRSGAVMVMDWGIAKAVGHGAPAAPPTRAGALVGTPSYMSPEQARGKNDELDERSDLYAATVLFHELLTLRHYLGERPSADAVLVGVIADEVSFRQLVQERSPEAPLPPAELLRFVAKGLEKDPADRFQSAQEMIQVLEGILEARSAITHRVASARRWFRGLASVANARLHLALVTLLMLVWGSR
jgi:serine/threonine-protein kinase